MIATMVSTTIVSGISAGIGLVVSLMLLHPSQETFVEMQWNATTQRVEIAMRLSILDEQSLAGLHSKAAEPIFEGIANRLRFGSPEELDSSETTREKRKAIRARYHWVGRQAEGAHVWCYLEYAPPANENGEAIKPTHIRCDVFAKDRSTGRLHAHEHATPLHRYNVLSPEGPKAFSANTQKPIVEIRW